jgi:peptidoglycan/LPS O-acetylase OafA/YrhL
MRGVAASMIFVLHMTKAGDHLGVELPTFLDPLTFGVDIFFLMSGYLISLSLQKYSLRTFVIHRIARVVPLLWLLTTLISARSAWLGNAPDLGVYVASMFAVPGLVSMPIISPSAWSLSYEESFYLLSGLGWRFRKYMPVVAFFALLALSIALLRPRWAFLLVGVACRWKPAPLKWWPMLIAVPILLYAAREVPETYLATYPGALLCGWVGMCGLVETRVELLRIAPLQFIGTISYSFYLWQDLLFLALEEHWAPGLVPFIGYVLVCAVVLTGVSWLSYRVIEQDVGKLVRRLA